MCIRDRCWPKTVAAIELNHSTVNAPVRMTVELSYAYWESNDISINNVAPSVTPRNPSVTSSAAPSRTSSGRAGSREAYLAAGGTEGGG